MWAIRKLNEHSDSSEILENKDRFFRTNAGKSKEEYGGIIRPLDEVMANPIQRALDHANGRVEDKGCRIYQSAL